MLNVGFLLLLLLELLTLWVVCYRSPKKVVSQTMIGAVITEVVCDFDAFFITFEDGSRAVIDEQELNLVPLGPVTLTVEDGYIVRIEKRPQ